MLSLISTVAQIAAVGASSAVSVMGALSQKELAEESFELQEELALRKMSLEESIYASQQKLLDVQTRGIEEAQGINLSIAQVEAELRQAQVERQKKLLELSTEVETMRLQREAEAIRRGVVTPASSERLAIVAAKKPFPTGAALVVGGALTLGYLVFREKG